MAPRRVPTLRGPARLQSPRTRSLRGPQLPGLVSPSYPRAAGLCLPHRPHGSEPPHRFGLSAVGGLHCPAPLNDLRSPSPAGPSLLATAHLSSPDLSVVA